MSDKEYHRSIAKPLVVADAPLWSGRWDYAPEREVLERAGVQLEVPGDERTNESLLATADIVLRGGRRVDAQLIATMHRCIGLVTYSVGLDGVDLDAAERAGIAVRNVPGYCTDEVSDHAILLILAALRRLPYWLDTTGTGGWLQPEDQSTVRRVRGLTVGIVGAGKIGRSIARKASAFGMVPIGHDPFVAEPADELPLVARDELLARADVIVLCASATSGSLFHLGADDFASLTSPPPVIVNVARGAMLDERALADALHAGTVWAAALDVRSVEPPDPADDPLAGAPNLLLTPHVAASSAAAIADLRTGVAEAAIELLVEAGRLPRASSESS